MYSLNPCPCMREYLGKRATNNTSIKSAKRYCIYAFNISIKLPIFVAYSIFFYARNLLTSEKFLIYDKQTVSVLEGYLSAFSIKTEA